MMSPQSSSREPSYEAIGQVADKWLRKCKGDYSHPAQRWLFELCHEIKAMQVPLQAEEARKNAHLRHLEQMLAQWNECVAPPRGILRHSLLRHLCTVFSAVYISSHLSHILVSGSLALQARASLLRPPPWPPRWRMRGAPVRV